jgi:hypothetical protein
VGHVTQIFNLLKLTTDIQEAILYLPRVENGAGFAAIRRGGRLD